MKTWRRMPGYWFDSRLHYFVKNHGALYAGAATLATLAGGLIWRSRRLVQRKPRPIRLVSCAISPAIPCGR
jgi:hypothetical protein